MKTKYERIKEMHNAGFSPAVINSNLNQQGYQTTTIEIMSYLGIQMKQDKDKVFGLKKYKVNEKAFTSKTTEELKNLYYIICELLNKGLTTREISSRVGRSQSNIVMIKNKFMIEVK